MTDEQLLKNAKLIVRWCEEDPKPRIQCRDPSRERVWRDVYVPVWNIVTYEYRETPNPLEAWAFIPEQNRRMITLHSTEDEATKRLHNAGGRIVHLVEEENK